MLWLCHVCLPSLFMLAQNTSSKQIVPTGKHATQFWWRVHSWSVVKEPRKPVHRWRSDLLKIPAVCTQLKPPTHSIYHHYTLESRSLQNTRPPDHPLQYYRQSNAHHLHWYTLENTNTVERTLKCVNCSILWCTQQCSVAVMHRITIRQNFILGYLPTDLSVSNALAKYIHYVNNA